MRDGEIEALVGDVLEEREGAADCVGKVGEGRGRWGGGEGEKETWEEGEEVWVESVLERWVVIVREMEGVSLILYLFFLILISFFLLSEIEGQRLIRRLAFRI